MRCDRCHTETNCYTMSLFNTEEICMPCKTAEMNLPEYPEAVRAEFEAVKRGDYNFPGIGYPK